MAQDRYNNNSTAYEHPQESNLLNIHKVMQYNAMGQPVARVHVDGISLEGNVIIDTVSLSSSTLAALETVNVVQSSTPWIISGTVIVSNFTSTVRISNTVTISNTSFAITNFPTTSTVYQGTIPWVTTVTNWPALQYVNGVIYAVQSGTWNVGVSGSVIVSNFTSTVSVSNTVTVNQGTTPWIITGTVAVGSISGTVEVMPGGATAVSAFGEPYGITIQPVLQLDSIYGVTSEVIQTYTTGTGSTLVPPDVPVWTVKSGNTLGSYGVLRSKRFLRYRPGQGALARFTAAFTTSTANSYQFAGMFNLENQIGIGWRTDPTSGLTKFGVSRATGGRAHVAVLTIVTPPTGTQTATIRLNGAVFTATITAGTAQATAVSINKTDGFTGWLTDQVDNTIVFLAESLGPRNGTYSFSCTGAGTLCTGSFSTKQLGLAQTEYWTYQDQFNVDRLDGTKGTVNDVGLNPSGMTLRSQFLNVYQINFRWLGVGEIRYAIENELDGNMLFFHHEHYTNKNSLPHVAQPSFKIGYVAYNLGNATTATVSGASMMGAIEGEVKQNELNRSTSVNKTGLAQNTMHHLLTIRNPYVTNGGAGALNGNYVLNAKEVILKDVSIGTQNTDPAILYVFFEPTTLSSTHSYFSQPKDNVMVSTVDGTLDPTVDTPICQFVTSINGATSYPMRDFRVTIPPGSYISFAIKSTNAVSRATLAVVFSED